MRRTAMRKTILTASLAAWVGVSAIGCKSMPSLTWWKTAKKNDAASTAVAHTAPALPSDVAIQTEGLAAAKTAAPTGTAAPFASTAAPFASTTASGVTPAAYPNTGVPGYPTTSAPSFTSNVPASYPSTSPSGFASTPTANLGSIALPYNPNAAPPAATIATAPAATAPSADRYTATSTPSFSTSNNLSTSAAPYGDTSSRYGSQTASTASTAPSYTPVSIPTKTAPANNIGASQTGAVGDRYAQAAATTAAVTTAPPAQTAPKASSQPITQTVATGEPYRPGGTSSYPGASQEEQNYELAARPKGTNASTSSQAPNVATPSSTPAPAQSSQQVPRYW